MTVAAYIDPLPAGWPKRGTQPCRDCPDYKHQRCPGCMGTGTERTEDWGPYHSGSFTVSTMGATLRALGFVDGIDTFALSDLLDAYRKLYAEDDLTIVAAHHQRVTSSSPCGRELLQWALEVSKADGVDPETANVYVA